jgi:riboflavin synthase
VKGSIVIDGISLTIAGWRDGVAELAIIPFTYAHTNLRDRTPGDAVNLECDILSKYIERLLEKQRELAKSRLSLERLTQEGF